MAKAIIEFDLKDTDDIREFYCAVHSNEMALFIWELKNNILRKAYKEDMNTEELINLIQDHLRDISTDIDALII
jgi:hypothetical protein